MYRDKCPKCYGKITVTEKAQMTRKIRKNDLKMAGIDDSFLSNIDIYFTPLRYIKFISKFVKTFHSQF